MRIVSGGKRRSKCSAQTPNTHSQQTYQSERCPRRLVVEKFQIAPFEID